MSKLYISDDVPDVVRRCDGILKFHTTSVDSNVGFRTDFTLSANDADDCAVHCYNRACSSALFVAPQSSEVVLATNGSLALAGVCGMNFVNESLCVNLTNFSVEFNISQSIILKCFTCDGM